MDRNPTGATNGPSQSAKESIIIMTEITYLLTFQAHAYFSSTDLHAQ